MGYKASLRESTHARTIFSMSSGWTSTPKVTLFKNLESRVNNLSPSSVDAYIVDGFFFLDIRKQYGKLARHILQKLCHKSTKRIDLVFDHFITPSIKGAGRDRRVKSGRYMPLKLSGSNQQRTSYWLKASRNDSFKTEFSKFFLVDAFQDDSLRKRRCMLFVSHRDIPSPLWRVELKEEKNQVSIVSIRKQTPELLGILALYRPRQK